MKIADSVLNEICCRSFLPEKETEQVLITLHGFAGDKDSSTIYALAEKLTKSGILVFAFDLPSHGTDKGTSPLKLSKCFEYVSSVIQYIKKEYNGKPISFFATSFGGYLLLNFLRANKIDCKHIILKSPAIFMEDVLQENILSEHGYSLCDLKEDIDLGFERPLLINKSFLKELKENSLKGCSFDKHIDIIQGDMDDVVSVVDNERYYKEYLKSYNFYYIKNADHRFKNAGDLERVVEIVKDIFRKDN